MEQTKMTRRNFLTLGGIAMATAAAAGAVGCAPASGNDGDKSASSASLESYADGKVSKAEIEASLVVAEPITDFSEELTYDIVVVGAGTAGVPAALAAAEEGAKVAVLQREASPIAQGMLAARVVKEKSTDAGMKAYLHEMHELNQHRPKLANLKAFVENSEEALQWYEGKLAEAGFSECKESDSKDHIYEDGNCYIKGLLFPKSMQAPSTALMDKAVADKTVDAFYNTPAVQLVTENGTVTGVIAKSEDGSYKKFNAKNVILTTGDYQNNDAMLGRYVPDALPFERKQMNKTGDGHLMGLLAGAVMEPGSPSKMIHGGKGCFREEPFLAVNMNGERFMYEDVPYGDRNTILRDQPDHLMYSIFDANYSDQVYGWGSDPTVPTVANGTPEKIEAFVEDGTLLRADTIQDLANAAGLPAEALEKTVKRYNELCEAGEDLDFGKASKYMQPVNTAPFYAIQRKYMVSAILGGLAVDEQGRCLDAENNPIPGLFAAGNCSGYFYGRYDYSLSTMGLSVGRCVTMGYLCGKAAANA